MATTISIGVFFCLTCEELLPRQQPEDQTRLPLTNVRKNRCSIARSKRGGSVITYKERGSPFAYMVIMIYMRAWFRNNAIGIVSGSRATIRLALASARRLS